MKPTTKLRQLLAGDKIIVAPGAPIPMVARLIEQEGFPAVYHTGGGAGAAILGMPDISVLTMTEIVTNARNIAARVSIPIISDADTGYGGILNVRRTVWEFEQAGVAGIHLEDQELPKRSGHAEGKRLVPKEVAVQKIRAAVDARRDPDFVIIARVDAIAVEGFNAAIDRANSYLEAGADMIFVEAPRTKEEIESIPRLVKAPHLFNMAMSGITPSTPVAELERLGYKVVIFAGAPHRAMIHGVLGLLRMIKETGSQDGFRESMTGFTEVRERLGAKEFAEIEERYKL